MLKKLQSPTSRESVLFPNGTAENIFLIGHCFFSEKVSEAYLEPSRTFQVKIFVEKVNDYFHKSNILDVHLGFEYASGDKFLK